MLYQIKKYSQCINYGRVYNVSFFAWIDLVDDFGIPYIELIKISFLIAHKHHLYTTNLLHKKLIEML